MNYRREIDGLRALAVLPVIFFHAGFPMFGGGFIGVDVFFVISGYLITTIIINEMQEGRFSLLNFYERRARRILPALFFVMAVCLPLAWLWLIPQDMKSFSQSLMAVSVFASNILFWRTSGYFDGAAELKPLLHTWSLAVEEQYYVLFPLFLILAWRLGPRWILGLLIAAFITSLAAAQWLSFAKPTAAFFLLPTRGWELLIGAFIAFYFARCGPQQISKPLKEAGGLLGVALIFYAIVVFDKQTPFPGFYALIPTLGTALIILCTAQNTFIGKILGCRILVGIGLISYSAYLWHQPLLAFARHASFEDLQTHTILAVIALTFGLATISWRYVERPFRQKFFLSQRSIFMFAVVGTVFFAAFGLAGHLTEGFANRSMAKPFEAFAYDTTKLGYTKCEDPFLLKGSLLNYCHQSAPGTINAVLIGDSHADDKFYGLQKNSPHLNWALIGNSSCPPVLGVRVEGNQKECLEKFEKIITWIKNTKDIQTVVVSLFGQYPLTSSVAADHMRLHIGPETIKIESTKQNLNRADLFHFGLSAFVGELINAGKKVIIVVDIPELPFFPVDCVKGRPDCEILRQDVLARQSEHRNSLARLKKEFPTVRIFDPLDLFCTAQTCTYRNQDKILYRDSHHLTLEGSDVYGQALVQAFPDLRR